MLRFLRNITSKSTNVHLGRWEHRMSDKQKDLKILWANTDNCGDKLCGPSYNKDSNKPKKKKI
tara:strand:- start:955 stop:1143 length:189 start_codon:yes stop_codon:yes gene_type:complete